MLYKNLETVSDLLQRNKIVKINKKVVSLLISANKN